MPFYSRKSTNGNYEIYNAETGQIYSKYSDIKKAKEELLNFRMAYHLGIEHLAVDIINKINESKKAHKTIVETIENRVFNI